jgi:uncharacterized membrane protein
MQCRHKALACLFFLHSLRSYSFVSFFLSLIFNMFVCSICARAMHIVVLFFSWSLPYHILSTYRSLIFLFFSFYSTIPTTTTTTSSFVRLLVRQHFEKKRKREQINSNRQEKKERHIVLHFLSLIYILKKQ